MHDDDAATRFTDLGGVTWFFRCGECHALYVPAEGINLSSGTLAVYWTRPDSPRRGAGCQHHGKVERWDGGRWLAVTIREGRRDGPVDNILPDPPTAAGDAADREGEG